MSQADLQPTAPPQAALAPRIPSADDVDAMLAEMAQAGRRSAPSVLPSPRAPAARQTLQRVRYSHEAMADMLIANPWISQNEVAEHFGRTATWISIVINSDAFQAYYAARKAELVDPELILTINERFKAVTVRSLQVLQEKLQKSADLIPDTLVLRAAELGAKALGVGGNAPPPAAPNPVEYLPAIAERLLRLRGGGPAVDAVVLNHAETSQ